MSKIQPVRGTKDYFFEEQEKFSNIVSLVRQVSRRFGYSEASTPIFEFTEVFKRSLGDFSDIVNKEMYTFEDRKGQSITLRPEFTASIMRAIDSNGLYHKLPLKLFSWGPLFRYERPQRGRMRQFHQINCEYVGSDSPFADVEVISLAQMVLLELGLANNVSLEINSLGDLESRQLYVEKLVEYYHKYKNDLSEDSKLRLENNPLRILDSKDEGDKKINEDAPRINDYLTDISKNHFDQVLSQLEELGIKYNLNKLMVRGLDYYCHTTFEFVTSELGAQGTVLAGGRYNGLMKMIGGKDYPGVGFAGGVERLSELYKYEAASKTDVSIITLAEECASEANKLAYILRKEGLMVEIESGFNSSKSIKKALERGAKYGVFIGVDEVKSQKYKVKNFLNRQEQEFSLEDLIINVKGNEF